MPFDVKRIQVGMVSEKNQHVTEELTAEYVGSGNVPVLATPMIALFVEKICHEMVEHLLPPEHVSVGISITLNHFAPTPIGDDVRIRAEITSIEERRISYAATIWDSQEKVGEAAHTRAIVSRERFLSRVRSKTTSL